MKNKRVAVVVLNYNGLGDTLECLDSVYKSDYPSYKVFLVDNGSSNFPCERIRESYPGIIIAGLPCNLGFAGGNNIVLAAARVSGVFDYVLLLNNDATVKVDTLSNLVEAGERDQRIGVVGCLIRRAGTGEIWYNGAYLNPWTCISQHVQSLNDVCLFDTGYVSGCCMLIKKQLLNEIGILFEDYFTYLEDVDYCTKAHLAGWRVVVNQLAVVDHKASRTSDKLTDYQFYFYLRNRMVYMRRHAGPLHLLFFTPYYFTKMFMVAFLKSLISGNTLRAGLAIKALVGGLRV